MILRTKPSQLMVAALMLLVLLFHLLLPLRRHVLVLLILALLLALVSWAMRLFGNHLRSGPVIPLTLPPALDSSPSE